MQRGEVALAGALPRGRELLDETIDVVKVIYLVCADMKKMIERLRRRALKENRFDDANDTVIQNRLEVYERETKPVLEYYPADRTGKIDATMNRLAVLSEIIKVLAPIKSAIDHARETQQRSGLAPAPPAQAQPAGSLP